MQKKINEYFKKYQCQTQTDIRDYFIKQPKTKNALAITAPMKQPDLTCFFSILDKRLQKLQKDFPKHKFKLSSNGDRILRYCPKNKKEWVPVCIHNRQKAFCKDKTCGGGTVYCVPHGIQLAFCETCGGHAMCIHKIQRAFCEICGGNAMCMHKIQKAFCEICGGNAMCQHEIQKAFCNICGGNAICEHQVQRAFCAACGGNAMCQHEVQRAFCGICGGTQVCLKCKISCQSLDGFCLSCHPTYEFSVGCSKIACKWIDELEKTWEVKIQHRHFDENTLKFTGCEHKPAEWKKKKVDGYYYEENGKKYAFEFLGDVFHGHPTYWASDPNAKNHYGKLHVDLYRDTEYKLQKLTEIGYHVMFIWECDFKKYGIEKTKTFDGRL